MKCLFCNLDMSKIENTILDETSSFYVIPAVGALVDGYILIITKDHKHSMSELSKEQMKEYSELIDKYRYIFKNIYGHMPIVFEHGSPNIKDFKRANSVIHAHTHIVNHQFLNESGLIDKLNFKKVHNLKLNINVNYIYYVSPSGIKYMTYNFDSISQLMRIKIANDLNLDDKFDWKKDRFDGNIKKTIDTLLKSNK